MATTLIPYLNFNGHTAEAMHFYHGILGGKLEVMRMGDAPMDVPAELKDRVMHAALTTDSLTLLASDGRLDQPTTMGDNVHLSLHFVDVAEQSRVFEALAVGGTVTQPLTDAFFGRFGTLKDRFGACWMFICAPR